MPNATAWREQESLFSYYSIVDKRQSCEMKWLVPLLYMQMGDLVIINTQYPHLGASPDGVTMCECCDKGVVELKCPYSAIDFTPRNLHWSLKKGTLTSIKC